MTDAPEPLDAPDDDALASVAALAQQQLSHEAEVARLESLLKDANKRLSALRDGDLPTAMATLGLDEFRLTSGDRVQVRERYVCGQLDDGPTRDEGRSREERLNALAWLDRAGHGDLARRTITVVLGAKSSDIERQLLALLAQHPRANSFTVDHRLVVPWNTLSAFTREQVRQGEDPPLGVLGVTVMRQAKITRSKDDF
jgi:hypothetical protein